MYQEILRGIAGIEMYPVFSLLLFVVVFGIMLIRVAAMDRACIAHVASLPLDVGLNLHEIEKEAGR